MAIALAVPRNLSGAATKIGIARNRSEQPGAKAGRRDKDADRAKLI